MTNHNYIAEPGEYPTVMQTQGYKNQKEFNNRFKKTPVERAEIFALSLAYKMEMIKEHGKNWKKLLRKNTGQPFREFRKTIVSGTKILYAWN